MVFDSKSMYSHALYILEKYKSDPCYIAQYLGELLKNNASAHEIDVYTSKIKEIINDAQNNKCETKKSGDADGKTSETSVDAKGADLEEALEKTVRELKIRKSIEDYYLPKQLVDAIIELGAIPENSMETKIGVAFLDIADYSYVSKFLSPMENQSVLNGLYSCFNWVLKKRSGYLNKIEGDSIMFQFGGLTDPVTRYMEEKSAVRHIAKELFYTCVELQKVCFLFNQADNSFFDSDMDQETKDAILIAYNIIGNLRSNSDFFNAINALFQLRIRIGANVGEVTIGNFGPAGAKQWDIIGLPVIEAKRMESTAPIGGLRISKKFFDILMEIGVIENYFNQFKQEAQLAMGYFKDISVDELFLYKKVLLKDKKNAIFESYSVQVSPSLPEVLSDQVKLLLYKGEEGIDKILELLEYYRGNKFVINAIESVFIQKGVNLRKGDILKMMYPAKYTLFLNKLDQKEELVKKFINITYSLYDLFDKLGKYQDKVNSLPGYGKSDVSLYIKENSPSDIAESILVYFQQKKLAIYYRTYFYDMIYPSIFISIRSALIEYMNKLSDTGEADTVLFEEDGELEPVDDEIPESLAEDSQNPPDDVEELEPLEELNEET
ncbi:MAG: adenylate/guanylate cyclase domain-containing protein [Spirochaetaceae bacterium]|nr:adenylate/guanylate cyclase domain-containing protein [Spirochaetaceae bacterium]